jgi:hypothetical protein
LGLRHRNRRGKRRSTNQRDHERNPQAPPCLMAEYRHEWHSLTRQARQSQTENPCGKIAPVLFTRIYNPRSATKTPRHKEESRRSADARKPARSRWRY